MYSKEDLAKLPESSRSLLLEFENRPHVLTIEVANVGTEEEAVFQVAVLIQHYFELFRIYFNPETLVGEVYNTIEHAGDHGEITEIPDEYIGLITVEKLKALLSALPHIDSYLEDENQGMLH